MKDSPLTIHTQVSILLLRLGLQDARKGVLFESLPPVLQLQLKRFEYDFARDTMVKVTHMVVWEEGGQKGAVHLACRPVLVQLLRRVLECKIAENVLTLGLLVTSDQ
jgi:hypothetical protein